MRTSPLFFRGAAAFALCTAILVTGCSEDSTTAPTAPATLSSIAVSPTTATLAVAATQALTVTGTYSDASTAVLTSGVTFTTSASGVATVSAAGLVTAVAGGSATITATASGRTATAAITVNTPGPVSSAAVVFSDNYDGVSFVGFGGAVNNVTVDATTLYNGRKSIRAVMPTVDYGGGAFVSSAPRNLSTYNALTFYARGSVANASLNVGIGNNGLTNVLNAESLDIALTTNWVKYIIPLPNPAKMVNYDGLFHFADGPLGYTVWFADIQYENLPVAQVAAPTGGTASWPTATVAIGTPYQMNPAPNTVIFTTPVLPNGGRLTDVAWRWFNLTSSNPAVATVSPDGLITALTPGTTTVTATIGGIPIPGSSTFTVSAPLAVPTTIAPAPTKAAGDVISLFTTVYTNRAVETWRTGWSASATTLTDPFAIGSRNVKRYLLSNFVGIEFGAANIANAINATTMTHIHLDIWTPNPATNLEIQLVNSAGAAPTLVGLHQAGTLATGSWVSLNIPLTSFAGLSSRDKLNQLLFVASGPMVIYVDNIYFYK
jgi:uncharacterized protein YjdB